MFSLWLTNERRTREKNIVCISVYSLTIVLLKTIGKGDKILQNAVKWSTYGLFKVATLFYYYKNIVDKYRCDMPYNTFICFSRLEGIPLNHLVLRGCLMFFLSCLIISTCRVREELSSRVLMSVAVRSISSKTRDSSFILR